MCYAVATTTLFPETIWWGHTSVMVSQSTGNSTVYLTVCTFRRHRKHQRTALFTPFEGNPSLTHCGRVTHICVSKQIIIGSDNGLSPGRRQAIIWTNAGKLLFGPPWTHFSGISIEIYTFSFNKVPSKTSFGKCRPFCLGLNVLTLSPSKDRAKHDTTLKFVICWLVQHFIMTQNDIVRCSLINKIVRLLISQAWYHNSVSKHDSPWAWIVKK